MPLLQPLNIELVTQWLVEPHSVHIISSHAQGQSVLSLIRLGSFKLAQAGAVQNVLQA